MKEMLIKLQLLFFFAVVTVFSSACEEKQATTIDDPEAGVYDAIAKVYKSDGSVQCGSAGVGIEEMALELVAAGITTICGQKGHDGVNRPTTCGQTTGNINVYIVLTDQLEDAEAVGFASIAQLPNYQDSRCSTQL
jgi:hypothetical protein